MRPPPCQDLSMTLARRAQEQPETLLPHLIFIGAPFPRLQEVYWGQKRYSQELVFPRFFGTGKKGHYERGLFAGGISRISRISKFSRISRKWSDSPLLSRVWGFSRISRKWTFLKRPLFQKTPFSEPKFLANFGRTFLGNKRNTVSRVLVRRRELTEPH